MTTADPRPTILDEMRDLLAAFPTPVRREMHVAKMGWQFLRDTFAKAVRPDTGTALLGLPIVVAEDLTGGQWQIREDGEVTSAGDMAPAPEGWIVVYSARIGWYTVSPDIYGGSAVIAWWTAGAPA